MEHISAVAKGLKVNPKTIRYYEEIGLIPPAQRNDKGHRIYSRREIKRLAFILTARQLDFSLDDIGEILALREDGVAPCLHVTELVAERFQEIDQKIAGLRQLRGELEKIQQLAASLPREEILEKDCICHLIENEDLKNGSQPTGNGGNQDDL